MAARVRRNPALGQGFPTIPLHRFVRGGGNTVEQMSIANQRRQLRRDRDEHADLTRREGARLGGLHDEDALQGAALDQRDAEERVVRILSGLGEVFETRMLKGVGDHHRRHLLSDETGQPLVETHPDAGRSPSALQQPARALHSAAA